jgi:hypothetical protein
MRNSLGWVVWAVVAFSSNAWAQQKTDAKDVAIKPMDYADRTLLLDDRFGTLSQVFTSRETELGYRPDEYLRMHLLDSKLVAFVSKNATSTAFFKNLRLGTPITVKGVVRAEVKPGAKLTEIDMRLPDRTTVLIELQEYKVGWDKPLPYAQGTLDEKGYKPTTVRELLLVPERHEGKNVRVEVEVGPSLAFSRMFGSAERELGMNQDNTIKMATLHQGMTFYVQKTPANVDLILALAKGDNLLFLGHVVSDNRRDEQSFMFVVDRMTSKKP